MNLLKGENRYALIIFGLMVVLAGALVFVGLYLLPQVRDMNLVISGVNNELVHVPRVISTVAARDGTEHVVQVDFTLAVDEAVRRDLDIDSLHARITGVMSTLEHDRINDVGGMDYIKTEVIRELGAHIEPEDFRGIFIRNINRDNSPAIRALDAVNMANNPEQAAPEPRTNLNDFFRGLGWR